MGGVDFWKLSVVRASPLYPPAAPPPRGAVVHAAPCPRGLFGLPIARGWWGFARRGYGAAGYGGDSLGRGLLCHRTLALTTYIEREYN